eukprot:Gregarina_sp_Poly_1__6307@NODE_3356_length_1155_cov_58_693015_g2124_i0_p2_GENE_NODE_3356_length_1155_cov_58_693015_g2124_i0NODE_3356_length_1155_cov_58_693015_g2124_i0_p2_ORF_typecomplete_len105_score6_03DUF1694/PF07997_11/0_21_NODE_3356_length_1155_cov_58_693015_g2124_i043315
MREHLFSNSRSPNNAFPLELILLSRSSAELRSLLGTGLRDNNCNIERTLKKQPTSVEKLNLPERKSYLDNCRERKSRATRALSEIYRAVQ